MDLYASGVLYIECKGRTAVSDLPDNKKNCEFRSSPEGPVSQMHSPHLLVGAPGIVSDLLRFVQMLKREWGAESNGKLPHIFIPSKTATYVPEFAMEDLPLGRIAAFVPEFAMKDLALDRTLMMIMMMKNLI